jgi:hypothetical protein
MGRAGRTRQLRCALGPNQPPLGKIGSGQMNRISERKCDARHLPGRNPIPTRMARMTSAPDNRYRLSKSKIAAFEHCPKRLWLQVHRRDAAKFDEATLARFRFGHDVGEKARFAVHGGVLVDTGWDMPAAIARTRELLSLPEPRPIFEATFQHEDVLIRADILMPDGPDAWQLIEVKGASKVSGYQLQDVATQAWVARSCGVNISRVVIRHLARAIPWWRADIGAVTFRDTDVTDQIERQLVGRPKVAVAARGSIRGPEPIRAMGMHCYRPLGCEYRAHCRAKALIPEFVHHDRSKEPQPAQYEGTGEGARIGCDVISIDLSNA